MKICLLLFSLFLIVNSLFSQNNFNNSDLKLIDSLLSNTSALRKVWLDTEKHRLQIIYTRVFNNNKLHLENYIYNLSDELYFYPASLVKLPVCIFALEKLNKLKPLGVKIDTKLSIDRNFNCQTAVVKDKLSDNLIPTLRNYILKALILSDNESYNRLYEFVGQEYMNKRLVELGYKKSKIIIRFSPCDTNENRHTNGFKFYNNSGKQIYYQKPAFSNISLSPPIPNMKIEGFYNSNDKRINSLKDFSYMNFFPLLDMHDLLIHLVHPELYKNQLFITNENRKLILESLSSKPKECSIKKIAHNKFYYDFYTNYLYYGSEKNILENKLLKIYNIVGQSYGFLSDVAYFKDSTNNIEFFLSAVIYNNNSSVIENDIYQYNSIGLPFLRDLGKCVYNFELGKRKKISNLK